MGIESSWLKKMLLPAYYYSTWPCRQFGRTLASWLGKQPIAVLFYHRVADTSLTPWTISNRDFLRQIEWLERHFEIISLPDAQHRLASGRQTRSAACITFDDGYAENCEQAIPLLLSRRIPFAYFVATDFVLGGQSFPHDVAYGVSLAPNSRSQLQSLAAAGVEMGAHTRSHCDLGRIRDARTLQNEIVGSRDDLQQITGAPVRYFAFPYGQHAHLSTSAFEVARRAGFAGVCSAYGGYNFPGEDAFHLQREHGDPCFLRLKNRLMFDPRIAGGVRRFTYDQPGTELPAVVLPLLTTGNRERDGALS